MPDPGPPLVSVVIPAYNAAAFLEDALASVAAQDYEPLEAIVVDDGSSDGTSEVARSFQPPVTLIAQPHAGIGAARNAGVAAARGEFLAFLDADDLWTPSSLVLRLKALEQRAVDLVYGQVIEFRGNLESPPATALLPGTVLLRASAFHRVGWFRTDLRLGEFIDWSARAREAGLGMDSLAQPVLRRRIHGTNIGIRDRAARTDYVRVVRAALERRRREEKPGA
jgi:glycosyltransferase involved in cell wall biosynthesis